VVEIAGAIAGKISEVEPLPIVVETIVVRINESHLSEARQIARRIVGVGDGLAGAVAGCAKPAGGIVGVRDLRRVSEWDAKEKGQKERMSQIEHPRPK